MAEGAAFGVSQQGAPPLCLAWCAMRLWRSHPSLEAGLGVWGPCGARTAGLEPPPPASLPGGGLSAGPCGFPGASRSGLWGAPFPLPPRELWTAAAGPQTLKGDERGLGRQRPQLRPQRPRGERPAVLAGSTGLAFLVCVACADPDSADPTTEGTQGLTSKAYQGLPPS